MWNREASVKDVVSAQPSGVVPPAATRPAEERRLTAWVGKSVIFRGDVVSSEDMTIDGRVEGTIEVRDHALIIGPDADIHADIVAKTVTILGAVTGSITAQEKVEIRETGSVAGDVLSPRIAMLDGAVLRGRVETSRAAAGEPARYAPA